MKYLNAGDSRDLFLQKVHPGSEFLSNEVPTAAGLQLGDQALIGQPKLLSVICSRHSRDGALKKHWATFRGENGHKASPRAHRLIHAPHSYTRSSGESQA